MTELDATLLAENRAILDQLQAEGSDLSAVRMVDFEHLFEKRDQAEVFLSDAEAKGYRATLYDRDDGRWDAQLKCELVPTAEAITLVEQTLGLLAVEAGGKPDGWGFYRTNP